MFINPELCGLCGGKCCKQMPGEAFPNDIIRNFGGSLENALNLCFASGEWVIDCWEGDPRKDKHELGRTFYVRPRGLKDSSGLYNFSWGTQCGFLQVGVGCSLKSEIRPTTCQRLEPGEDGCKMHNGGGKQEAAIAWIPYQPLIDSL